MNKSLKIILFLFVLATMLRTGSVNAVRFSLANQEAIFDECEWFILKTLECDPFSSWVEKLAFVKQEQVHLYFVLVDCRDYLAGANMAHYDALLYKLVLASTAYPS